MSKVILQVKDINGTVHLLEINADENKSIIDHAEDHGIELPYSCRSGACFSCCATVHKGIEHLDQEKTGEALIDVEEDEVLTCICGVKSSTFTAGEDVEIDLEMLN